MPQPERAEDAAEEQEAKEEPGQITEKKEQPEPASKKKELRPLGYFDDNILRGRAEAAGPSHWYNRLSQAAVSYDWALIKTFSKYFAKAVPFINCQVSIADTPEEEAIPITLSAYMSSLRNLCLSNTKYELKHLILEKTSVSREQTPVLQFARLKLADGGDGQEEQTPPDGQASAGASEVAQRGSSGQQAAQQNVGRGERAAKKQVKNFMFTQAYAQAKDIDCATLRPR